MRVLLVILLVLSVMLVGCTQRDTESATSEEISPVTETPDTKASAGEQTAGDDESDEAPAATSGKIVTQPSGLKIEDKKVGKGDAVRAGDSVTVHYKGWLDDGTVFDTSKKPGAGPFTFTVGQGTVIKGWDEGLVGMKVGGVRELTVPPKLGYGSDDVGPIPPNSTLHFEVELLGISKAG